MIPAELHHLREIFMPHQLAERTHLAVEAMNHQLVFVFGVLEHLSPRLIAQSAAGLTNIVLLALPLQLGSVGVAPKKGQILLRGRALLQRNKNADVLGAGWDGNGRSFMFLTQWCWKIVPCKNSPTDAGRTLLPATSPPPDLVPYYPPNYTSTDNPPPKIQPTPVPPQALPVAT